MYNINKFFEPNTINEAVKLLSEHPEAKIIAGGSDILLKIREGKLDGCSLISIFDVQELKGVTLEQDGTLVIAAATSFTQLTNDQLIQKYIPVLANAVDQVGGPQIRNIGTIGGNIANGMTSADSASTLFALNAQLEILSSKGSRVINIKEFYLGPGKVDLQQGELLTKIKIPKVDYDNFYGHYIKYAMRNAMDIATLGCVAIVKLSENKDYIEDLRLAFGVAGPIPMRCPLAEKLAKSEKLGQELLTKIAKSAVEEVQPRTSWRASKEFRLHLVEELSKRALKKAINDAGGTYNE